MLSFLGSVTSDNLGDGCKAAADAACAFCKRVVVGNISAGDNLLEAFKVAAGTFLHAAPQRHSRLHVMTHDSQALPPKPDRLKVLHSASNKAVIITHFLIHVGASLQQQPRLG